MNVEIVNLAYNPVQYMEELKNLMIQFDSYHLVHCNGFDGFSHSYLYENTAINLARYMDLTYPDSLQGKNDVYCYGALVNGRLVGYVHFNLVIHLPILGSNFMGREFIKEIEYRLDSNNHYNQLNNINELNTCYILGVMVTNEYRNTNIAEILYQYMEKTCIENNVFRITSSIAKDNSSSVHFHMKQGYKISSLEKLVNIYRISKDLR